MVPDDRLGLMFACAHPAIDPGVRAPLILQTLLGFDAAAVASAFLVAPATMGQRLVRAKAKIREAGVPFRIPDADELPERLDAVLAAIYAAFSEGWSDAAGTESRRRNLAEEGLFLGRLTAALLRRPVLLSARSGRPAARSRRLVSTVRQLIQGAGARLWFLPPYSPDLNPIEKAFAKIKHWMRKAQKRTVEDTWRYLGELIQTIPQSECANYLESAGYASVRT